jgi:hypothetical protein
VRVVSLAATILRSIVSPPKDNVTVKLGPSSLVWAGMASLHRYAKVDKRVSQVAGSRAGFVDRREQNADRFACDDQVAALFDGVDFEPGSAAAVEPVCQSLKVGRVQRDRVSVSHGEVVPSLWSGSAGCVLQSVGPPGRAGQGTLRKATGNRASDKLIAAIELAGELKWCPSTVPLRTQYGHVAFFEPVILS